MRASYALAAAATLALLSCGPTRAAIMVRVETNLAQPPGGDLNSVRVRVYSGAGTTRTLRHDSVRVVGDNGVRLPFRFAVLPRDEAEGGVVTVEAVGCSDALCGDRRDGYDPVLVEQRAIVSFIPGQVWELPMFLAVSCRGVRCTDPELLQTCRPETGTCGPAQVTPGAADAGRDASVDGAPDVAEDAAVDASAEAAADVTEDARADAAADARADVAADAFADVDASADTTTDVDAAATDARADAAVDAAMDADVAPPTDARADAVEDVGLDADAPAPIDAPADVGPDADATTMDARDVEADTPPPPDAPADLPTEPVRSCGTGASAQTCRASEDCCVLGSCGCILLAVCTPRGVIGCR
ncbi:MAG: hypothetical protein U0324_41715 [Polyangiales bacterium]